MRKDIKGNLLLVEDEEALRETLALNLELEGYEVTAVDNGMKALAAIKNEYFDTLILDIMLPEMDGITICENIRGQNNNVPILFLSAKGSSEDRVNGLKMGGDDYMVKPFDLDELLIRIEKLISKNKKINDRNLTPEIYVFGKNKIDFAGQTGKDKDGKSVEFSKREIALLRLLIEHKGEVVSREHILQAVWGYNVYPTTRTIDNFILNFRKYFEKDSRQPKHFHSVRGVGYKFTE